MHRFTVSHNSKPYLIYNSTMGTKMKKRVSRVEAIVIMRAARELRAVQPLSPQPAEPVAPEVLVAPLKKSIMSYVVDFFKKIVN